MRSEDYSTALAVKFIQAQNQIESEHQALAANAFGRGKVARIAAANRRVDATLSGLQQEVDRFHKEDVGKIYREGYASKMQQAKEIYKRNYEPPESLAVTSTDRSFMSRQRAAGRSEMTDAIDQANARSRSLTSTAGKPGSDLGVGRFAPVQAGQSMFRLDSYGQISASARSGNIFNRGALGFLSATNSGLVLVSDGGGCGWIDHEDSEMANGKVVTLEEARGHSMAHPYCQRQFWPKSDPENKDSKDNKSSDARLRSLIKKSALIASGFGAAGGAIVAYDNRLAIISAINKFLLRSMTDWQQFDLRIRALQRTMERTLQGGTDDVLDIRTGKPLSSNPMDIMHRMSDDMFNFERGVDLNLNPETRKILGVGPMDDRVTVIDRMGKFHEFYEANSKAHMSDTLLTSYDQVQKKVQAEIVEKIVAAGSERIPGGRLFSKTIDQAIRTKVRTVKGPSDLLFKKVEEVLPNNNVVRMTLPRLKSENKQDWMRALRGRLDMGRWVRFTGTQKITGKKVGSMVVNRNGLFRLGFQYSESMDPLKRGFILPRMSFVPKGPVRILTRLNRGHDGAITSLSGQLRILIPGPFSPSSNFNIDLRSLHLNDLWDIRNIRLKDLMDLTSDNFKIRSLALESRFRLMGTMDFRNTMRMKYEDIFKLFSKTDDDIFMTGERKVTILRKFRTRERQYFGEKFMDHPVQNLGVFNRQAGQVAKEYYVKNIEMASKIASDVAKYGLKTVKNEYHRQKTVLFSDIRSVTGYLSDIGQFLKGYDPRIGAQILQKMAGQSMEQFLGYYSRTKYIASQVGRKEALRIAAEGITEDMFGETFGKASAFYKDFKFATKKQVDETLSHIMAGYKRVFVDLPAERRRKQIGIIRYYGEGSDAAGDIFNKIVDGTTWTQRIKIYGDDLLETASRFKVSIEDAAEIRERVLNRLKGAYSGLRELSKTRTKDELATFIANHPLNSKERMKGIRNWREFFATDARAVEASGRVGESAAIKLEKAADLVAPKPRKPLLDIDRELAPRFDYRLVESPMTLPELAEKGMFISEELEELDVTGDTISKMQKMLTMLHERFGLVDLDVVGGQLLPDNWYGGYYPLERSIAIRGEFMNIADDPKLLSDVLMEQRIMNKTNVRIDDHDISTFAHELGHAVDAHIGALKRRAGDITNVLRKIPNVIELDSPLLDRYDATVLADVELGMVRQDAYLTLLGYSTAQKADYLNLWKFMSINQVHLNHYFSQYAMTNPGELLAEIFRNALLSNNPSSAAVEIFEMLEVN